VRVLFRDEQGRYLLINVSSRADSEQCFEVHEDLE
jgi:hypothetical protein